MENILNENTDIIESISAIKTWGVISALIYSTFKEICDFKVPLIEILFKIEKKYASHILKHTLDY